MKEKRKNEQAGKDYYSAVLLSQIICSAIVLIMFFCFKSSAGGECLKNNYSLLLKEDFMSEKLSTVVSAIGEYFSGKGVSLAVSGNKVVPYEETTTQAETTTELTTVAERTVFTADSVSEIALKHTVKATIAPVTEKEKTKLVFPVEEGRFTSLFGERTDPLSEGDDYHHGVDIGADEGDRIRAVSDGIVSSVGEDSISGKYIIMTHSESYDTLYCHCSEIIAEEGSVIRKGETIALVGSTGYSTGPHLHFEVRRDGESIDPMPFLENAA